jgi:hypothetical protein
MEELHKELNEKKSELRRVQDDLSRRDKEHISDESFQSLRSMLMALQKENSDLKVLIVCTLALQASSIAIIVVLMDSTEMIFFTIKEVSFCR